MLKYVYRVVVLLFLNIIIFFNKRKLERLIKLHNNYDDILAQSQKLDKLINKKILILMSKKKNN